MAAETKVPCNSNDTGTDLSQASAFITNRLRKLSVVSAESSELGGPKTPSSDAPPKPIGMLTRRRSSLRNAATSLFMLRRLTRGRIMEEPAKPKIKMENTYRMEPNKDSAFDMSRVEETVMKDLKLYLKDETYSPANCATLTCELCTTIKNSVKKLNFPRYKFVCQVIIGQCMDQGIHAASRNIWDPSTDNYACISFKNDSLFAMAIICATYYE